MKRDFTWAVGPRQQKGPDKHADVSFKVVSSVGMLSMKLGYFGMCINTCVCIHTPVCPYVCMFLYVCEYKYLYVHVHIYIYTHIRLCVDA